MAWMIGIDEAGYGPNLGPLVVAASAWWVEEEGPGARGRGSEKNSTGVAVLAAHRRRRSMETCLYRRLEAIVSRTACDNKLAIADSKQLYKPGHGLRQLERGVLVGLLASGKLPANWGDLMARHAPSLACYADHDCRLPIDATTDEITDLSTRFQAACGFAGVKLMTLRARLVYPHEFNALTTHFGTKGAALSHVSIGLLRETMEGIADHSPDSRPGLACSTQVVCDKHGGRNRYAALLQHHFPDVWIDTLAESGPASRYAWGLPEARVDVCFRVKGEAELPVALASMTAKYHRELAMRAFNAFWCDRIPDLRPTAGYPTDAKRYKAAIATLQKELGIEDDVLWRWR